MLVLTYLVCTYVLMFVRVFVYVVCVCMHAIAHVCVYIAFHTLCRKIHMYVILCPTFYFILKDH